MKNLYRQCLQSHNICFGREVRKLNFRYALLTKVLAVFYILKENKQGPHYVSSSYICFILSIF